jgi:hypothetical protein
VRLRGVVVLAALFVARCAELAALSPDGTCGNAILEEGEECDTFGVDGFRCGPSAGFGACRYLCDLESGASCPSGRRCGIDGLCRSPSGRFAPPLTSSFALREELRGLTGLELADLDGDRLVDLASLSRTGLDLSFGDRSGTFAEQLSIPIESTLHGQTLADLDGDGRPEIVFSNPVGLAIARIAADRSVSLALPPPDVFSSEPQWIMSLRPDRLGDPDLVLMLIDDRTRSGEISLIDGLENRPAIRYLTGIPLISPAADIDLDRDRRGTEVGIAFSDGSGVSIFGRCVPGPLCLRATIGVDERVSAQPLFGDADGDGAIDLILEVGDRSIAIAYGDGHDHFCSAPWISGACMGVRDRAAVDPRFEILWNECGTTEGTPLGIADFDGDGVADYLTFSAVFFGAKDGQPITLGTCLPVAAPNDLVIGDFDANGRDDLAIVDRLDASLFLLRSLADGTFTSVRVVGPVEPQHLTRGDFDGDGISDLVFSEAGQVTVGFGQRSGEPFALRSTRFEGDVVQLLAVDLADGSGVSAFGGIVDPVDDLLVFARSSDQLVTTLFAGSSDRRFLPPSAVALSDPLVPEVWYPGDLHAGHFEDGGNLDDLLIRATNGYDRPTLVQEMRRATWWRAQSRGEVPLSGQRMDCEACELNRMCPSAIGDLTQDGVDEIVSSCSTLAVISFESSFLLPRFYDTTSLGIGVQVSIGDFDGDSKNDVLTVFGRSGDPSSTPALVVFSGGSFARPISIPIPEELALPRAVAAIDLDGDPASEIVLLAPPGARAFKVRSGTVEELPLAFELPFPEFEKREIHAADVNGDGLHDLLVFAGDRLHVYLQLPIR